MKMLITQEEFNKLQTRDLIPLECQQCHTTFEIKKHFVQMGTKKTSGHTCNFCSIKCFGQSKIKKEEFICKQCSKKTFRNPSQLKKSKNIFCSQSCAASYNNTHKTKGCRRSKLEIWLETQLSDRYSTLAIDYNRINTINAELDIYIPSLKLAFELNGIFHYEPIYGKNKLSKIQTNDNRKFQACIENEIELCIIDTSTLVHFKQQKAEKFLNIIVEIIEKKLLGGSEGS